MKTIALMVALLAATGVSAKPKRQEYKASAEKVYQAIYRIARNEGQISFADEKRMTVSFRTSPTATTYAYDCSASVEPSTAGAVLILNVAVSDESNWLGSNSGRTADKFFKKVQDEPPSPELLNCIRFSVYLAEFSPRAVEQR
jgi:hypothetical protein